MAQRFIDLPCTWLSTMLLWTLAHSYQVRVCIEIQQVHHGDRNEKCNVIYGPRKSNVAELSVISICEMLTCTKLQWARKCVIYVTPRYGDYYEKQATLRTCQNSAPSPRQHGKAIPTSLVDVIIRLAASIVWHSTHLLSFSEGKNTTLEAASQRVQQNSDTSAGAASWPLSWQLSCSSSCYPVSLHAALCSFCIVADPVPKWIVYGGDRSVDELQQVW